MSGKRPRSLRVPRAATVDAIIDAAKDADGIKVEDLQEGDDLVVRTRNNVYAFRIIDPSKRMAFVSGGIFPETRKVHILGCSLSGTGAMVRLGWIGVGYRLAIGADVLLSRTVEVQINGCRILPAPKGIVH